MADSLPSTSKTDQPNHRMAPDGDGIPDETTKIFIAVTCVAMVTNLNAAPTHLLVTQYMWANDGHGGRVLLEATHATPLPPGTRHYEYTDTMAMAFPPDGTGYQPFAMTAVAALEQAGLDHAHVNVGEIDLVVRSPNIDPEGLGHDIYNIIGSDNEPAAFVVTRPIVMIIGNDGNPQPVATAQPKLLSRRGGAVRDFLRERPHPFVQVNDQGEPFFEAAILDYHDDVADLVIPVAPNGGPLAAVQAINPAGGGQQQLQRALHNNRDALAAAAFRVGSALPRLTMAGGARYAGAIAGQYGLHGVDAPVFVDGHRHAAADELAGIAEPVPRRVTDPNLAPAVPAMAAAAVDDGIRHVPANLPAAPPPGDQQEGGPSEIPVVHRLGPVPPSVANMDDVVGALLQLRTSRRITTVDNEMNLNANDNANDGMTGGQDYRFVVPDPHLTSQPVVIRIVLVADGPTPPSSDDEADERGW